MSTNKKKQLTKKKKKMVDDMWFTFLYLVKIQQLNEKRKEHKG